MPPATGEIFVTEVPKLLGAVQQGLFDKANGEHNRQYSPDTQEWVRSMYRRVKEMDDTRIVEDNSACNYDHVETDINTWHFYLNGYMTVKVKTPCMITCIKELNEPRYMSVSGIEECFAKPLVTMTYETLKDHPLIDKSTIGLAGSPTNILTSFTPPQKGAGMMLEGSGKETTDKLAGILAAKHII